MADQVFGYGCPDCGQGTVKDTRLPTYTTKIKGCPFVVKDALIGVCDSCGSKHFVDSETEKWVTAFEESQSSLHLSPQEIKEIRRTLGLTMDEFSFLIGCSRQSLYNWESEPRQTPQSRMADLLIRMVRQSMHGPVNVLEVMAEEAQRYGRTIDAWPGRPAVVYDATPDGAMVEVREAPPLERPRARKPRIG